jgi:predicted metal-binding protein
MDTSHLVHIAVTAVSCCMWCFHFLIAGLRAIGKDFYLLQKQVPSRTVKEIVEFYYLWKKTERHDAFTQTKPVTCNDYHCNDH